MTIIEQIDEAICLVNAGADRARSEVERDVALSSAHGELIRLRTNIQSLIYDLKQVSEKLEDSN